MNDNLEKKIKDLDCIIAILTFAIVLLLIGFAFMGVLLIKFNFF